jgi:hypothetical protein
MLVLPHLRINNNCEHSRVRGSIVVCFSGGKTNMQTKKRFDMALAAFAGLALLLGLAGTGWGAYAANGDGTVTDTSTGLIWQQTDDGQARAWQNALPYCEDLELAGQTDWHLPNIRELQSIVDYGRYNPSINPAFSCRSQAYWSGTTSAYHPDHARYVHFGDGQLGPTVKTSSMYVRCVRGGAIISVANTTKEPPINFITLPSSGQLKNLRDTPVSLDKPTVIITHGWNREGNEIPPWIVEMSIAMMDKGINANILWWDWIEQAKSLTPLGVASNAPYQGKALAAALLTTFGQSHNRPIHFIGHSMGTRVNRVAVNELHLPTNGWDPNNTHVTILDAPDWGPLDTGYWSKCIPDNAFWVDNYVTAFGELHHEASNVILPKEMPITISPSFIGLIDNLTYFHKDAVSWYIESIENPSQTQMGFRWSFEYGGLIDPPPNDTYFLQSVDDPNNNLFLENITLSEAESIINIRNYLYTIETSLLVSESIRSTIETRGNAIAGINSQIVNNLQKYTISLILTEASPSFAWIPISIPQNAEFMSFDFKVEQAGDGDYLSVGIQNELLFMLDIEHSSVQQTANSGYLNICEYAGIDVELFFGLNTVGDPNAKIIIENIIFYSRLLGDNENDRDVDGTDLATMIQSFGSIAGQSRYYTLSDLNGDGVVDRYDIPKFSEKFGYAN